MTQNDDRISFFRSLFLSPFATRGWGVIENRDSQNGNINKRCVARVRTRIMEIVCHWKYCEFTLLVSTASFIQDFYSDRENVLGFFLFFSFRKLTCIERNVRNNPSITNDNGINSLLSWFRDVHESTYFSPDSHDHVLRRLRSIPSSMCSFDQE